MRSCFLKYSKKTDELFREIKILLMKDIESYMHFSDDYFKLLSVLQLFLKKRETKIILIYN